MTNSNLTQMFENRRRAALLLEARRDRLRQELADVTDRLARMDVGMEDLFLMSLSADTQGEPQ